MQGNKYLYLGTFTTEQVWLFFFSFFSASAFSSCAITLSLAACATLQQLVLIILYPKRQAKQR